MARPFVNTVDPATAVDAQRPNAAKVRSRSQPMGDLAFERIAKAVSTLSPVHGWGASPDAKLHIHAGREFELLLVSVSSSEKLVGTLSLQKLKEDGTPVATAEEMRNASYHGPRVSRPRLSRPQESTAGFIELLLGVLRPLGPIKVCHRIPHGMTKAQSTNTRVLVRSPCNGSSLKPLFRRLEMN
jgi:hypothetical protein